MRHVRIVLAVAGALSVTTSALWAADLPNKAPLFGPPALNWTGCYLGANIGWVQGRSDVAWDPNRAGFPAASATAIATQAPAVIDTSDGTAGGQVGCNYQAGAFVIGIEGDLQWTGVSGSKSGTVLIPGTVNPFVETVESKWLSTVRGRLGFARDRWFLYGTGGIAFARVSYSDAITFAASGTTNAASFAETRTGWVGGAGLEWALAAGWSVKLEYLHVDFGTSSFTSANSNPVLFPLATIGHRQKLTEEIARFGVNYRFGWGPVIASY